MNAPDAFLPPDTPDGLMTLVEVTCELALQHDLDDILRTVTTGVCDALSCERASLFLLDEDARELYTRVVTKLEIAEIRFSIDSGIAGWVARERQLLNVPDPYDDERFNSEFDRQTGFRTRNILASPVFSRLDGRLVGVLQILNKSESGFDVTDERVLQAFAAHAASALERHKLLEEAKKSQALALAVEMGRRIQTSFLPDSLPDVPGYELAAWWQPAESVSGDYYDVLRLPDGRLGLVVADVSGHGVGPSLIMASARAMLRVLARTISDPEKMLSLVSRSIFPDLEGVGFITFLMTALDPQTHRLAFANAGHGPVLHYRRSADAFEQIDATGFPLGVQEESLFDSADPIALERGDILVLMTDGAWELTNPQGEQFGVERLEQFVRGHRDRPVAELLSVMQQAILEFHPDELPPDDVTLLLVKRCST